MNLRRFFLSRACALAFGGFCLAACSSPSAPPIPVDPPTADAGPDQAEVPLGSAVTLDGSGSSDPEGQSLTYRWTAADTNPAPVVLSPQVRITFTLSQPGAYIYFLTVEAGARSSQIDSVRITVSSESNEAPVAHAGVDAIYPLDAFIFLDGASSTDADGDPLTFLWELVSGPDSVTFADSSAHQTRLSVRTEGQYEFRLTVSDQSLSDSDEVIVFVSPADNIRPQASAGSDLEVTLGTVVILDGTGSNDPDSTRAALSFHWTMASTPDGKAVVLTDSTTATPSFTPGELGEYILGLIVDDGLSSSIQDIVTITVVSREFNTLAGMIEIPAGSFSMGSNLGNDDERPVHTVDLSTFWFDSVEVTTGQYQLCVNAGVCSPGGQLPGCNGGGVDRDNHPINCVDWSQANTFCGWRNKRLPTEAEWEKAARGEDGRRFPWGDDEPNLIIQRDPTIQLLNHADIVGTTVPVGMHPDGVSFYGVHNMAANVQEWTADIYGRQYYEVSPEKDPQGPAEGPLGQEDPNRVARGGTWQVDFATALTATVRNNTPAARQFDTVGFRCASTDPP